ncbi:winged helix-turn-helix domain-containing protein [Sphingomonas daechungensis]|uniref:Winged helix-turn-helix domain-containing protein n=2 Tax=Sphingomonas daechungensis TaxID=1176646 RepID=A0ABX6SYE0_9SPHN|nr:winged helix-turn-helix domain-containing protein [Sphingomonas daechungensis]QNP42440.1 winged helix-turn-helix domain-containing protein [Sphingomonas daechungensis]
MQLLVALARARGGIVTRDELIAWCWDGRIVGEDAINRAVSRLRQVASEIGGGTFAIETITKVGYRIVDAALAAKDRSHESEPSAPTASRRNWLFGAGAAVAGALGTGLLWRKPWQHRPDPEAVELVRLGDLAQRASRPDQTRQAVSYFERAVRIDPLYGAAWGMLALSYTHGLDGFSEAQLAGLPDRIRSAANRALELEPDNPDAQLALACVLPYFRNWSRLEPELSRIQREYPDHWLANGRLAILYYQVGRLKEGAALHMGVIKRDPMIPGPYAFAATALSRAGQIQDADALLKEAADRWPANPFLWHTKYDHLLFTGRAGSAAAMLMDPETRPSGTGDAEVAPFIRLARAIDKESPEDIEASVEDQVRMSRDDVQSIAFAAPVFALLGRPDLTLASLERYYLNEGSFGEPSPIGPYTRRYTDQLYWPAMTSINSDRRFRQLTTAIGLSDYWDSMDIDPLSLRA